MGRWKKPKWLKKAQTAASNVVKPITTSAPVKNIQRAAQRIVPKKKPAALQKLQKAAQSAATKVQKKIINPITTSKPIKNIQKAAQKASDKIGDEVREWGDVYKDRDPKVKQTTGGPTQIQGTTIENPLGDPIDRQISAQKQANRAMNNMQERLIQQAEDRKPDPQPILRAPWEVEPETESGQKQGILVAGNDGWRAYPKVKPPSTAQQVFDKVSDTVTSGVGKAVDAVKDTYEALRPDRPDTRVFVMRFFDKGWATPEETMLYRKADHDRDYETMKKIRDTVESRMKSGVKVN